MYMCVLPQITPCRWDDQIIPAALSNKIGNGHMRYVLYGVIVIGLMGDIGGGVYLWGLLEARKAEREGPTVRQPSSVEHG